MKSVTLLLFTTFFFQSFAQNVTIPDGNFKAYLLNDPAINTNGDSEIQVSEATAFTDSIICFSQNINSIVGIEAFTNLSFLNVALNSITSIDITQNTQLTALICPMNNISTLTVGDNALLEELVFWDNDVSTIDVTMCPQLRRFEFPSNSITSLDISQNPLLEILYASGNQIGNMDFSIFPNLTRLELNGCGMTTLDVTNNPLLTTLVVEVNDISVFDLSQNLLLENMKCAFNEMTTLDLSMCPNLNSFGSFACDNLVFLNLQNGNNVNFTAYQTNASPNLACIQVDDVAYSTANWTSVDATSTFSLDCNESSLIQLDADLVSCYPNPMTDELTIEGPQTIKRIQLYSDLGKIVMESSPNSEDATLNVANLSNGVYFVTVIFENDEKVIRRIVK